MYNLIKRFYINLLTLNYLFNNKLTNDKMMIPYMFTAC